MKILLISAIISILILFISHNIGSMVYKGQNTPSTFAVGFSFLIGTLFVFTEIMVRNKVPTSLFHTIIGIYLILLFILSFRLRTPKLSRIEYLVVFIIFTFMMIQSFRYTLGEQMGDSVYIFNIIDKNIISTNINDINISTGMIGSEFDIALIKSNIPYYFMFSSINYFLTSIVKYFSFHYIPPYAITMWVSNFLFYFLSAIFVINVRREFKPKNVTATSLLVLWLGLYTGSIYYNITLPHIVVTMLVLIVAYAILELYRYINGFSRSNLIALLIILFSFIGYGGTGGMFLIVFCFGLVAVTILYRSRDAYLQIPYLLIPVLLYANSLGLLPSNLKLLFVFMIMLLILVYLFYKFQLVHKYFSLVFPIILILLWFAILTWSKQNIEGYLVDWADFMTPQGGADRTQDYFSFYKLDITYRNIIHYFILLVSLFDKKTRPIGLFIIISLMFFITPWTKPFVLNYFSRKDVYNRIFFTIFNSGTIGIGILALYNLSVKLLPNHRRVPIFIMSLLLLVPTFQQSTSYFYPTYESRELDYNSVYKMSNNQIEVLEKMRQIITLEEIKNPRIISQIFGTAMYAPEFSVLGYNVTNQRYGKQYMSQPLYEIFYTPAIPGDNGPRLEAPVRDMCSYLIKQNIDFVIFDKELIVYDEIINDYLPIYWYIRDCAEFITENDRYQLYRFYFR